MKNMAFWFVASFSLILMGLLGIAFLTLLERKSIGLSQNRQGPNKITYLGIVQPVIDGIKLLTKVWFKPVFSSIFLYFLMPIILMVLLIVLWLLAIPWSFSFNSFKLSSFLFFCVLGFSSYCVLLTGLSSVSTFSKLGGFRSTLQSLSFEVAAILVFIFVLISVSNFSLFFENKMKSEFFFNWMIVWMILSLLETNRTPFDLMEGESELISGFNVEMMSYSFVFLFLSEYGMMLVFMIFMKVGLNSKMSEMILFMVYVMVFFRSCFPRVRFDFLMSFMWQTVLPFSLLILMIFAFF